MTLKEINPGNIYSIEYGPLLGAHIVCISKTEKGASFLQLPERENVFIPYKDIESGLQENILRHVEKLPSDVFKVCVLQYEKNL